MNQDKKKKKEKRDDKISLYTSILFILIHISHYFCLNKEKKDKDMTLDEITYKINGCAMKVHNILGNGFQEVIYQRSLAIELEENGLVFGREIEHVIFYKGTEVGTRRADFIVENEILVELKALVMIEDVHIAQVKNYVFAYNLPIGLLINFGSLKLQFHKIYGPKRVR